MNFTVFDIESDGLLEDATKIHCLSYQTFSILEYGAVQIIEKKTLSDYKEIKDFILSQTYLVGHNIVRYDIPLLEKILSIKSKAILIDTLGLSWYLTPSETKGGITVPRRKHGLETWGEYYGVPKPEIEDWKNLTLEQYSFRCEQDVNINTLLWVDQYKYLLNLYDNNLEMALRAVAYLTFKLDCLREQEENPCHIDKKSCEENLTALNVEIDMKVSELSENMPLNKKYRTVTKPKKPYKKDGTLSVAGQRWENWIQEYKLDPNTESFELLDTVEEGNPNSHKQVKEWLLSLGWEPTIIKESTSKVTNITTFNPQITDDEGEICPSLKELFKDYPYLSNLENLALLRHRKGVFESFLDTLSPDSTVIASVGGFTNSLRMQHRRPIVNLPKVGMFLGKEIRGLIVVPNEDFLICGSDVSSLEDSTKQHFMYFFDPEYVKQMRVPGFDPHIDIAIRSNIMTKNEADRYKALKKKENKTPEENIIYQSLDTKRYQAKTGNFASVYGAGPPKLSEVLKCTMQFATNFHTAYWKRNQAVKDVASNTMTKKIGDQLWLFNPISRIWYSLRVEKDIFSVLNQGTGAYVEDRWIFHMRKKGLRISLQMHDEVALYLKKDDREETKKKILDSMEEVNKELKLNVPIKISIDFGVKYSEIH